jgi:hypothetical protein
LTTLKFFSKCKPPFTLFSHHALGTGGDNLGDSGAKIISQLLKTNTSVHTFLFAVSINLTAIVTFKVNKITDSGALEISQALKENNTLTELTLSRIYIFFHLLNTQGTKLGTKEQQQSPKPWKKTMSSLNSISCILFARLTFSPTLNSPFVVSIFFLSRHYLLVTKSR